MIKQYVEKVEGVYRLAGTRVSLDSVVQAFWRGQTAESIAHSFAVLTLEQVCHLKREGKSHSLWANPNTGAVETVPRYTEVSNKLARKICRNLSVLKL